MAASISPASVRTRRWVHTPGTSCRIEGREISPQVNAVAESPSDPNVAPTHLEVHERFQAWQVAVCVALGGTAIIAGIVLGIVLQND